MDSAKRVAGDHQLLQQITSKPIAKFGRFVDLPERKIRALAGNKATAIIQTEGAGGVAGGATQGFFRSQAELDAGQRHRQPQAQQR